MGESWLYETVCRQRPKLWVTVGYIKLCVDRDLNCGDSGLHEAVCRQRPELWSIFGSSVVTVSQVTEISVSISLWRNVEQQYIAVLHSRQCQCNTGRTAIYRCTAQQTVPL